MFLKIFQSLVAACGIHEARCPANVKSNYRDGMFRKNCIFTSAGNKNNIAEWLSGSDRSWDLISVFYGDDVSVQEQVKKNSDIFFARKGGKFQNLFSLYTDFPSILDQYDRVWVIDDDIKISPSQIETMFKISEDWDFWVCQPSFNSTGKVSHAVTQHQPTSFLRIVDFVEVNCPLFRKDKLIRFLSEYDGSLVGWGIDYWYGHVLESKKRNHFAVIDVVSVINPLDESKGGAREIDILQPQQQRSQHSDEVLSKLSIEAHLPANKYSIIDINGGLN